MIKPSSLLRKSWTCMFLAIRLLTLIAFTAHAVLGCCLSHGSCMREQVAVLNDHACDHHDHQCDSHGHEEDESHDNQASESVFSSAASCVPCPFGSHDHSRHCDDATCVFGVVGSPTTLSDLQFAADAIWIDESVDFWHLASRRTDFVVEQLDGPPSSPRIRALLQVWII
ncbi:hypothetical protein VN12_08895 [Pirellula sp. SH-Sr6A]|nr:hypothetical protein VN12_08895 [Pirellula sp. SH-Sr6A]